MKKLSFNCFLFLLGSLLFSSCGNEVEEPVNTETTTGTAVQLALEAEAELPVSEDELRNMNYDISKDIPQVLQSSNWDTHVFFSKKGNRYIRRLCLDSVDCKWSFRRSCSA